MRSVLLEFYLILHYFAHTFCRTVHKEVSMCGIFGYVGKKDQAAKLVLSGLKELEYRGYDSWGVAVVPTVIASNAKQSRAGRH